MGLTGQIRYKLARTIDYEFRCTVFTGFIDEDTVSRMGETVEGARRFAFQQFIPGDTLDPPFSSTIPYIKERISQLADIMTSYVEEVTLLV